MLEPKENVKHMSLVELHDQHECAFIFLLFICVLSVTSVEEGDGEWVVLLQECERY